MEEKKWYWNVNGTFIAKVNSKFIGTVLLCFEKIAIKTKIDIKKNILKKQFSLTA